MTLNTTVRIAQARRFVPTKTGTQTLYGVNALHPPYGSVAHANAITECQAIGAKVLRCSLTWSSMQTTSGGTIDWSETDDIQTKCAAASITPLFVIETTPAWANPSFGSPSVYAIPVPGAAFNTWATAQATWFTQVVTRYGTTVLYEWGNEWSSASGFWREGDDVNAKPTIASFIQVFNACYAAGKLANSGATIAVGGITALTHWFGTNATTGVNVIPLLAAGSVVMDAMAIHPYTGDSPTPNPGIDNFPTGNSFQDIGRIQTVMGVNSYANTPVWVTEWGNYDGATLGEVIKAQYWGASLSLIDHVYSLRALGAGKSAVTLACPYQLNNNSNGTTDTNSTGFYTGTPLGGPNTILPSGTVFKTFTGT